MSSPEVMLEIAVLIVGPLVASAALTALVRRSAPALGFIDVPNQRSSHQRPTARAGGLAIVITTSLSLLLLARIGYMPTRLLLALVGGGLVVAVVGCIDDRWHLSARLRLIAHVTSALSAAVLLGALPAFNIGGDAVDLGWFGYVLCVIGIVWVLNLFNFMDGIDGIAASEAVFVCAGGAVLMGSSSSASHAVSAAGFAVAGASLGFLLWNWPPAKIFMGDVGSGFLGYSIAVLAIAAARENPLAVFQWLILGGVFFVDATITLLRRLLRREKVYVAHRSHAYQWLARRWGSHLRVTLAVIAINVFWLLPLAWLCSKWPSRSPFITIAALAPLVVLFLLAGAGRAEQPKGEPVA